MSRISSGATSTGGRSTSPARLIFTSLKSGVPPGRTAGAGTWNDSDFGSDMTGSLSTAGNTMQHRLSTAQPHVCCGSNFVERAATALETIVHQETHTSTPSCFRISACSLSLIFTPA